MNTKIKNSSEPEFVAAFNIIRACFSIAENAREFKNQHPQDVLDMIAQNEAARCYNFAGDESSLWVYIADLAGRKQTYFIDIQVFAYNRAYELMLADKENPKDLVIVAEQLSFALESKGDFSGAIEWLKRTIAICEKHDLYSSADSSKEKKYHERLELLREQL